MSEGVRSFMERIVERPWVALVEFLLIGSMVYLVLRFLQGTRGARLVRAVLTILAVSSAVVWLIADQLESERLKLLYPNFLIAVFLVSLVAFQSELRRLLLKVGAGGWLRRLVRGAEPAVDPILQAVQHLSTNRTGALIAIERSAELAPVIETGVRIDALVSAELLETIFWPGTPLHDLGVVVQQGRLVAAGCQFPLTESHEADRTLGSRHRAAIGMSEEVDAVVVVVSEETGRISVAVGGKLTCGVTATALRSLLLRELGVDASAQSRPLLPSTPRSLPRGPAASEPT